MTVTDHPPQKARRSKGPAGWEGEAFVKTQSPKAAKLSLYVTYIAKLSPMFLFTLR